jgi:clan AA aspartic protease
MGLIHTSILLTNMRRDDLEPVAVDALVDSGAVHLCIPETVALQLDLMELEKRQVIVADGRSMLMPYVGPIKITFGNRSCYTGAMVIGQKTLLGAIPMEDMDLVIHPLKQQVTVNPLNPNIPASVAMGFTVKSPE